MEQAPMSLFNVLTFLLIGVLAFFYGIWWEKRVAIAVCLGILGAFGIMTGIASGLIWLLLAFSVNTQPEH